MDIKDMLTEAEHGAKGNYVESKITPDAEPFWIALKDRVVKEKVPMRPSVVCRLLRENYDINISDSAMTRYLKLLIQNND